jgi:hypothetical protein
MALGRFSSDTGLSEFNTAQCLISDLESRSERHVNVTRRVQLAFDSKSTMKPRLNIICQSKIKLMVNGSSSRFQE